LWRTAGGIAKLCVVVPIGILNDKLPQNQSLILAYSIKAIATIFMIQLKDPSGVLGLSLFLFYTCGVCYTLNSVDSIFLKNLPNKVRGSLMGFNQSIGYAGLLVYAKIAGYMHD